MTPEPVVIDGVAGGLEHLSAYSGLFDSHAWVLYPDTEEQLRRIFEHAARHGRRLTFRTGGRSFDSQSLGDDVVVSMERFDSIDVDGSTVRVGAGCAWGRVVSTLEPYGWLPVVTVTTGLATVGGTISGNCLSRFSAAYGREGTRALSIRLMTPDGTVHECGPPDGEPDTIPEKLFLATIGGLGYVGAVLSVTYRVLQTPPGPPPTVVETEVVRVRHLAEFVDRFVDRLRAVHGQQSTTQNTALQDAVYAALSSIRADGRLRALMFHSTLKRGVRGRPLIVYQPNHPLRVPFEFFFRTRIGNYLSWRLSFDVFHRLPRTFVNDHKDFTFFMDGNGRAKRFAASLGVNLKTMQQTFVIPSELDSDPGVARAKQALAAWLRDAARILDDAGLTPTFQDIVWLPRDKHFALSSTQASGGFAVSYAFDCNGRQRVGCAQRTLERLAEEAARRGGRVYLVKNVYVPPQVLREMYGEAAQQFRELKAEVDPGEVLRNPFFAEKIAV